jgi:prepilin-type N-terminal cleavage/methylation domain-containing protein
MSQTLRDRFTSRARTRHPGVLNQRGFTLLEVLVAVALLAMAVTITFQLFSANLRAIASSEEYVSATTIANAKMREVLDDKKLSEKAWSEKTDNGYQIDVSVSEVMKDRTDNLQVKLLEVAVTVSWASGTKTRSITLNTMKEMVKQV